MDSHAVISPCEKYRYSLTRRWDQLSELQCLWVMLNPSTADAIEDDPTIRRCISFSQRLGCGSLEVVNLFAYRASKPKNLNTVRAAGYDVVGEHNYDHWDCAIMEATTIVVAWGAQKGTKDQIQLFRELLRAKKRTALCLGTTQSGDPRHPLYVKGDADILPWEIN